MKRFYLNRTEDESGVSGTGKVAEGVTFSTGWTILYWLTTHQSIGFYATPEEMMEIHGHNGKTQLHWIDQ